jgi:hypothetical protein
MSFQKQKYSMQKGKGLVLVHMQVNDDMHPSLNLLVAHTSITTSVNMEDKIGNECDLEEELSECFWDIELVETLSLL